MSRPAAEPRWSTWKAACCQEWRDSKTSDSSDDRPMCKAVPLRLRALVKFLENIWDDDIVEPNIPTGVRLVYELDANLRPIKRYSLADPNEIRKAEQAVVEEGQAR